MLLKRCSARCLEFFFFFLTKLQANTQTYHKIKDYEVFFSVSGGRTEGKTVHGVVHSFVKSLTKQKRKLGDESVNESAVVPNHNMGHEEEYQTMTKVIEAAN